MATLRDPQRGCPWDREQSYRTIVPHTLEEAYEVAYSIEQDDYIALCDELGDLLFQIVFYCQLAKEEQRFEFRDVVGAICDKLERRHPHVFGDVQYGSTQAQTAAWEELKRAERSHKSTDKNSSILDGLTFTLPSVSLAQKIQQRVARVGFDWPDSQGVIDKVMEELGEVRQAWLDEKSRQEEIGDLLFACVNLARHADCDAESALRGANKKFMARFRAMERLADEQGLKLEDQSEAELDALWQQAKAMPQ